MTRMEATLWREQDWTEWDGEPIGWWEVADVDEDLYELDGRTYEAEDYYEIETHHHDCEACGPDEEVSVCFYMRDDALGGSFGAVYVDSSTGEVVGTRNRPGAKATLDRLWSVYVARHDLRELRRRWEEMQRIGPQIIDLQEEQLRPQTVVRPGPKVGRNDPCPCGSGRKYKKCCGGH